MSARLNVHPSKSLSTRVSPATHKLPKKVQQFSFATSSLHSEDNICVFKTWLKEICLFSVCLTQAMNLAGGQKLVTILFIFLAPLVLTHLPMSERCPAVFHKCTSSQMHKLTSFTSAQVEMSKHPSCEGKRSCKCIANAIYSKVDIFLGKRLILAQNCQMQERIVHQ